MKLSNCLSVLASVLFCSVASSVYAEGNIVINEFYPHPSSDNKEWVEIYNPAKVSLTNYWIDDDEQFSEDSGSSGKKRLDNLQNGKDPAYQFFEFSSLLNNSGDKIILFDETGSIVDRYEYTQDPGVDKSIGRSPNNTGPFERLLSATRGETNSGVQPTATVVPTETPSPTLTPIPTRTPTPTKSPTIKNPSPTKTGTAKNTVTPGKSSSKASTAKTKKSTTPTVNLSHVPTSVLGASTAAQKRMKKSNEKKNNVLVKEAVHNPVTSIVIIIGALCLIASGIIMFIKKRRST